MNHQLIVAAGLLAFFSGVSFLPAEQGVSDTEILLGQTAVFEGSASALGLGMRAGLESSFNDANEAGGIHGRRIQLLARDDGYEPSQSIVNTRRLIENDQVFALIGGVGTPTAKVIVPICEETRVPFVGAFTGAGLLRSPGLKYTINLRPSYNQEMERLAVHLVEELKFTKIACFYQNDAYGQAGLSGITEALKKRGLELAATGAYERNTIAVKTGLLDVRKGAPEAVVMVGAYKACAEFIRLARKIGMEDTVFCNISFVGTKALQKELGEAGEGVVISQVVPHPTESPLPIVKEYRDSLKRHFPDSEPDWVSLEGYLAGQLFLKALEKTGPEVTRENLLDAIATTGRFELQGLELAFGPNDRQGLDQVYLTVIRNGSVVELNSGNLASR